MGAPASLPGTRAPFSFQYRKMSTDVYVFSKWAIRSARFIRKGHLEGVQQMADWCQLWRWRAIHSRQFTSLMRYVWGTWIIWPSPAHAKKPLERFQIDGTNWCCSWMTKGLRMGKHMFKLVRTQLITSAAAKARGTFYVQFFHLPAFLVLHIILSYWDEAKDLWEPEVLAYLTALHNSCFQKQNVSFCPSPVLLKLSHFFLLYNPLRVVNKRN